MKRDIQTGVDDPLVNITEFEDKTLDEGYGVANEKTNVTSGTVSQAMIKRFNQHSIMVLKATKKQENSEAEAKNVPKQNGNVSEEKPDDGHVAKKQRIQSKITYEDLDSPSASSSGGPSLSLSKVERYLHGPMPDSNVEQLNPNEASSVLRGVLQETRQWQSRHPSTSLVTPAAAVGALGELSPGGALMRGFQEQSLARKTLHFKLRRYIFAQLTRFCRARPRRHRKRSQEFVPSPLRVAQSLLEVLPPEHAHHGTESCEDARSAASISYCQIEAVRG